MEELKKCILLCSNCHRELHSKEDGFDDISETILKEEFDKLLTKRKILINEHI